MRTSAIIFTLLLAFASCKNSDDTILPVKKNITQAVYASGKIFPINDYKVYSKFSGYIETIHVNVGDSIRIGDPLITIKNDISELNVNTAKNILDLAKKNAAENSPFLTALKQDVASAQSKYTLDSTNFIRYEMLFKKDATSKIQYEQSKLQHEVSKQNFLKAFNNYRNNYDRLTTELNNAQVQYDAQVSNRSDYVIASVVSGKIYDIIPKEGEFVSSQLPLMEIGDNSKFEVELSVDETDIGLVKLGQEVVITIDAYKDKVYKGVIVETYPRISQGNKTSKVIASIKSDNSITMFSGMSVEANIIISQKKDALVIPREFLIDNNKVKLKDGNEIVTIKRGVEDLEYVEITEGINENSEIIKP